MRLLATILASAVLVGCQPPPPVDLAVPIAVVERPSNTFVLKNGLVVVLQPDDAAEYASLVLRHHVASKDDPPGRDGLAHVVQHLLLSESRLSAPNEFEDTFRRMTGGQANTNFTLDSTDFVDTVRPAHLPTALWLEADRMAHFLSTATPESLALQRDVVKAERTMFFAQKAEAFFEIVARKELVGAGHPYAASKYGEMTDLDAITFEDVQSFAKRYRPNNATLVVAGAFEPNATRAAIESYFGSIPPGTLPARRTYPTISVTKERRVERTARLPAPLVVVAWPLPPPSGDGYDQLVLAVQTLSARAYESVRFREGRLADDVEIVLTAGHLGSFLTAVIAVHPGVDPERALDAFDEGVKAVSWMGRLTEWGDFDVLKNSFVTNRIQWLERPNARAAFLADDIEYRGRTRTIADLTKTIGAISAGEVGSAVVQFMRERGRVVVVVRPDENALALGSRPIR